MVGSRHAHDQLRVVRACVCLCVWGVRADIRAGTRPDGYQTGTRRVPNGYRMVARLKETFKPLDLAATEELCKPMRAATDSVTDDISRRAIAFDVVNSLNLVTVPAAAHVCVRQEVIQRGEHQAGARYSVESTKQAHNTAWRAQSRRGARHSVDDVPRRQPSSPYAGRTRDATYHTC